MTLPHLFLAWTLMVQVNLQVCQDDVCQPHPKLQEKTRVVRTLESEEECLALQIQVQQEFQKYRPRTPPAGQPRRHLAAKTTFTCVPDAGQPLTPLRKERRS